MGEVGCSAGAAEQVTERRDAGGRPPSPLPTPLPRHRPQLTKSYGSQPSKRKGKVMPHKFSWAQWPKTIGGLPEMGLSLEGAERGWPKATGGHPSSGHLPRPLLP